MPSRNPGVDRRQDAWRRPPLLQSPLGCDTHWGKSVRLNSGDVRLALCCIRPAQGTCRPSIEPPKLWMGAPPPRKPQETSSNRLPALSSHPPASLTAAAARSPGAWESSLVLGEGKEQPSDPSWGCGLWRLHPQSVGWDYTLPPYSSDECSGVGVTL